MIKNSRIKPIEHATSRSWDEWLKFMDAIDANKLDHHAIATKVLEELEGVIDNPGWWAQSVTVAYEQHIDRRLPGQRPDGTFQASVSKATKMNMSELMDAWVKFASNDNEVSDLIHGDARVSGTDKRITWRAKAADGSSVIVTSEPKDNGYASLIATHMGLKTSELNAEAKSTWSLILNRFLSVD